MIDDITINKWFNTIESSTNKKHWAVRNAILQIEKLISEYRITMRKMKGTVVAGICSHKSNILERRLKDALENK